MSKENRKGDVSISNKFIPLHSSEIVTKEIVLKILSSFDGSLDLISFEIQDGTKKGDNYLSLMFILDIIAKKKKFDIGDQLKISMMFKTIPRNPFRKEQIQSSNYYYREIKMYTSVLPKLEQKMGMLITPRVYAYSVSSPSSIDANSGNDYIAMENLKAKGMKYKKCRQSYAGICDWKSVINEYPPSWNNWRNNNTLTNSNILTSDNVEVPVHHLILASVSPYFKTMFTSRILTGHEKLNVHSRIFKLILDFAYTGEVEVNLSNVEQLLVAAYRFQILGIIQQCCKFLIKSMTPDNCLRIYKFGKQYFCQELQQRGKLYLLHNFKEILQHDDFLKLEFNELEDLLCDDLLNIRNEEMAFTAIRIWIEHAPSTRVSRLAELLRCVRFGLMSLHYFTNVVLPWKFIANNQEVQDSIFDAQVFLASMESRSGSDVDLNDPLARPRVPFEIIFAIGGWSAGSPTSFMETYDVRADRWFLSQGSDVTPRAYHGLVTLNHKIYMIGGFDGNDHFNTMRCFDPSTRIWTDKANMHFPRCYISCCVLDGEIYAMGGFNGRTRMNSVERYDLETNQWEILSPMTRQRSDASACSFNGKVYVAGGFNGQEVLNSVEVYDPVENQWSFIHPMQSPRSGVVITAYKEKLYAIGGFNGFTRLSTAERYNPQSPGDWESIAEMSSPRSNFASAVLDDMIFVIGGFNGTTTIPYVECYDSIQNEWLDGAHMNLNRSALAACVIRGLPNAREYSYLSRVQELLGFNLHNGGGSNNNLTTSNPQLT